MKQTSFTQKAVQPKGSTIMISCVAFFFGCAVFQADLDFAYNTILENHPGVYNELDPEFSKRLDEEFEKSQKCLLANESERDCIGVVEAFAKSFHDPHCWIRYKRGEEEEKIFKVSENFSLIETETGSMIRLPTFELSYEQTLFLKALLQKLPDLRKGFVVFDVRGNGGGNSAWGEAILLALFGEQYAQKCLAEMQRAVYVEWRASLGNLLHLQKLAHHIETQFGTKAPETDWIQNLCEKMAGAIAQGSVFYRELSPPPIEIQEEAKKNLMQGAVIVVIDAQCASACLDFLDGLKAMAPGVIFVGEPTGFDSEYMELRTVDLPSGQGTLGFPIKVYRNRPRGGGVPHFPDIPDSAIGFLTRVF